MLLLTGYTILDFNAEALGLGRYWTGRSNVALAWMLVLAVAGAMFTLWSLYLFVRFVRSFRRAKRELHGRWTRDDRAAASPQPVAG